MLAALLAANIFAVGVTAELLSATPVPSLGTFWQVQSVDTMKYSRDLAREKLKDPVFDAVIERQVAAIAATGATHVAVGTPYDEQFVPYLKRWVEAARRHRLNVWFRGNWSGWEGWFGYARLDRGEHMRKTEAFIYAHADLFVNGDIFTACPECENGGPGDPRHTGDVVGVRRFLLDEYMTTKRAFSSIGKDVHSNFLSMNGDVARLVMDRPTTAALDGIVTIDHYVATPQQLRDDVRALAERSGGRIVLGEFGVPIPDIHGNLTAEQQARWLTEALGELASVPEVIGVNYWLAVGGSTQLWVESGDMLPGAKVLAAFFQPSRITGRVHNELGRGVSGALVSAGIRSTVTDGRGSWGLLYMPGSPGTVTVSAEGYSDRVSVVGKPGEDIKVTLIKRKRTVAYDVLAYLVGVLCPRCRG